MLIKKRMRRIVKWLLSFQRKAYARGFWQTKLDGADWAVPFIIHWTSVGNTKRAEELTRGMKRVANHCRRLKKLGVL